MVQPPDITAFADLLHPIYTKGPLRYIYSYRHEKTGNEVNDFLAELEAKAHARYTNYISTFTMVAMIERPPYEKWHTLDRERIPHGILCAPNGQKMSLANMGEFKNIAHKSRIFHCIEPNGLFVLLTAFTGKKENELTAKAANPALAAREEYMRRKLELIARKNRSK